MNDGRYRTAVPLLTVIGVIALACAGGGSEGDDGSSGSGGRRPGHVGPGEGGTGGSSAGAGGGGQTGGGGPSGSGAASGAGATGPGGSAGSLAGCGDDPEVEPGYDGIDTSCVPDSAPLGCLGGLDLPTHTLALTIEQPNTTLLISVDGNEVKANRVTCTAGDGTPATKDNVHRMTIQGTDAADTLILDFLRGSFGSTVVSSEASIEVDLGPGGNTVAIRGSAADDAFAAWRKEDGSVIALSATGTPNVRVLGMTALVASLGPGADQLGTYNGDPEDTSQGPLAVSVIAYGGEGPDIFSGGDADDFLHGGPDDDVLNGLNGADWFEAGDLDGADVLNGGLGSDTVSYLHRASGVNLSMCSSTAVLGCDPPECTCAPDDGELGENDILANVENAHGTAHDDVFGGSTADNTFFAYAGNDNAVGEAGNDFLFGDEGDDVLIGGLGDDYLDGANGVDTFDGGEGSADICVVESAEWPQMCELY